MSNLPNNPQSNVQNLQPFTKFCVTIGAIPNSYSQCLTFEEQILWLCDYLQNTVIPTINNNAEAVQELQNLYVELKNYVDNYFTNLDVQDEINNKLNEMAEDGTLLNIVKPYIDEFQNTISNQLNGLSTKVNSLASGTPIPVSSISEMSDTSKTYLLTTDGNWYYYNGNQWTSGGTYQATSIALNSVYNKNTTFKKLAGNNMIDYENIILNGYYNQEGNWISDNNYNCTGFIPVSENTEYFTNVHPQFQHIAWNSEKEPISRLTPSNNSFTTPENCAFVTLSDTVSNFYNVFLSDKLRCALINSYQDNSLIINNNNLPYKLDNSKLKFLQQKSNTNVFNPSNVISNYYFDENGIGHTTNSYSTCIIPCEYNRIYTVSSGAIIDFWDENFGFLGNNTQGNTFSCQLQNVAYMTVPALNDNINNFMCIVGSSLPQEYLSYSQEYELRPEYLNLDIYSNNFINIYNKTWNCLGDSITANDRPNVTNYQYIIANKFNIDINNYGISGSTIANGNNPMCERYQNMSNDADIITIMGGTNDIGTEIGTINDTTSSTFYGALNILLSGLINKYPNKRIGFISPIQRRNNNQNLENYVIAIENACKKYSIPFLDLYHFGGLYPAINIINNTLFDNSDGLHPNTEGHKIIANKIQSFINSL